MKELVNGIYIIWCRTKIKAMENKNTNDYIFLARDNIKKVKNEKHYTSILISDLEKVKSIFDLNNHLYEVLPADQNIKLYFDLEIERDGINNEIAYNLVIDFLNWVTPKRKQSGGDRTASADGLRWRRKRNTRTSKLQKTLSNSHLTYRP